MFGQPLAQLARVVAYDVVLLRPVGGWTAEHDDPNLVLGEGRFPTFQGLGHYIEKKLRQQRRTGEVRTSYNVLRETPPSVVTQTVRDRARKRHRGLSELCTAGLSYHGVLGETSWELCLFSF